MPKFSIGKTSFAVAILLAGCILLAAPSATAQTITVKTVPWVATNPLVAHDTWDGKQITLKGTSDQAGADVQFTWDFGDGTNTVGTVSNQYAVEATHIYTGFAAGTVFTARLTVLNLTTGATGSEVYYVAMRSKTLQTEVNVAIDEGLWELHKSMTRYDTRGDWRAWSWAHGLQAANINAFEVNGHVESGPAEDPYTETVSRGMNRLFEMLTYAGITAQMHGDPDVNGNTVGIYVAQGYDLYQGGMFMDAIVASGTPNATANYGTTYIMGAKYKDIVQDMTDWYSFCAYDDATGIYGGAWRYDCNQFPDNSVAQWGAIGLIAGERNWGIYGVSIPQWVKDQNIIWLRYSQHGTYGWFGYTDAWPVWGPYATAPSGMVQMVMDGLGRGNSPPVGTSLPNWNLAESFMRDNWNDPSGYGNPIKGYLYGMFSFTKSMLLHDPPITLLHSSSGVPDLDWYSDPVDGIARDLVDRQSPAGYWWYNGPNGDQWPFETAWSIIMLNRTLFEAGAPVAVAKATPNPGVTGATITLDGSFSFHQDPTKDIVGWQWDLDNDGTFDASGPVVTTKFFSIADYQVRLRVTDNSSPAKSADTIITVRITHPPIAPTANAGRSYTFCPGPAKWYLDGSASVNPDEGQSEAGQPGDTIYGTTCQFSWDLYGSNTFSDACGQKPDVTGFWSAGSYLIQLKVTDTTGTSFPTSGYGDLSSTDSAQVTVKASCTCISNLGALGKNKVVQLSWTDPFKGQPNAPDHYNIYRSTVSGGPYLKVGTTTSTYSVYNDYTVTNGKTYYYVVRQAAANDWEFCQSNEARATPKSMFF
mgnify:CR=1 FL=1